MIYIFPTDTCFWIACSLDDTKSYHKIYEIKKRPFSKPLSIMVKNFDWLWENTSLVNEQIEFLKNYKHPFTILTKCLRIKMFLNLEQEDFEYKNKEVYTQFAFRVANNEIQKKLIAEIGPIFLTSANISWEKEIFDFNEVKEKFSNFWKQITFLNNQYNSLPETKPSDIFEFEWETLEVKYLRK